MHVSLFVPSIGYVMVSHCQQARYVHQFGHQFSTGDFTTSIPHTDMAVTLEQVRTGAANAVLLLIPVFLRAADSLSEQYARVT